jgi:hypothetical protein
MWACGDENIKSKQDKTKCEQLERLDTVYAHMCTGMYMYHSWTQSQASSLGVHGNNQARPCTSHAFSTESKGTAMQKPGNNAKAFGSSRQVVHK